MEKNDNKELNKLFQERKDLIVAHSMKEVSEDDFNNKMSEINNKITDLSTNKIEDVKTEESFDGLCQAPSVEQGKEETRGKKKMKKRATKTEENIDINTIVKYLKQQQKPKDSNKLMKAEIINELKLIKQEIISLQIKIRKM